MNHNSQVATDGQVFFWCVSSMCLALTKVSMELIGLGMITPQGLKFHRLMLQSCKRNTTSHASQGL